MRERERGERIYTLYTQITSLFFTCQANMSINCLSWLEVDGIVHSAANNYCSPGPFHPYITRDYLTYSIPQNETTKPGVVSVNQLNRNENLKNLNVVNEDPVA